MFVFPSLQSFACVPEEQNNYRFTKAHEYIFETPGKFDQLLNTSNFQTRKSFYSAKFFLRGVTECKFLLDFLFTWKIIDILDLTKSKPEGSFEIHFRTMESIHVLSKLPGIKIITTDEIPKTARVPVIYVHGFPPNSTTNDIESFFLESTPVVSVKFITVPGFVGAIVKTPSTECAMKAVNELESKEFQGKHRLTLSYQYKSTITRCFFVQLLSQKQIPVEDALHIIVKFGKIEQIKQTTVASTPSVAVKMAKINDAKLACGFINKKVFNGSESRAVFIEEDFFNTL